MTKRNELIMGRKEFEKWEDSIDGVLYDLGVLGDVTTEDENNKVIIAKTLLKLPKKIRRKISDEVIFILMTVSGTVYKVRFTKIIKKKEFKEMIENEGKKENYLIEIEQPLIYLNFDNRMKEEQKMNTIAHEIAHFILGDYPGNFPAPKRPKRYNIEKAADDLIKKWGFNRVYKSYKR